MVCMVLLLSAENFFGIAITLPFRALQKTTTRYSLLAIRCRFPTCRFVDFTICRDFSLPQNFLQLCEDSLDAFVDGGLFDAEFPCDFSFRRPVPELALN